MDVSNRLGSIKVENFLDRAKSPIILNLNFLGSCHPASKHPGSGQKYGNYSDVYYNTKLEADGRHILRLTFSGPTKFDVKKPNIKSIEKDAKEILRNLINYISGKIDNNKSDYNQSKESENSKPIKMNILGHSRGGVVASKINRWLLSNYQSILAARLSIADPYAGPINRRINKENDNLDKQGISSYKPEIPSYKIVVYTSQERRFRDPARSLKSKMIVLTDVSHDKTKYIAENILNSGKSYKDGVYICVDRGNKLKEYFNDIKKKKVSIDEMNSFVSGWVDRNLELLNIDTLKQILKGQGDYRKISYPNIRSDGRRRVFYAAYASLNKGEGRTLVKEDLMKYGRSSMWQWVDKNWTRVGTC